MLLLLLGCNPDQGIFVHPYPGRDTGDQADSGGNGASGGGYIGDGYPGNNGPSSDDDGPRSPSPGDLLISEMMINPASVYDEYGEWVEVVNISGEDLDLYGLVLADEGVDSGVVSFSSSILGPGDVMVFCAEQSASSNGGVSCQGDYLYQSFGGGFAMSNGGDEVILGFDSVVLDVVRYSGSQVVSGQSLGLDPDCMSTSGNDSSNCWCPQYDAMSGGDQGSPGKSNDGC